MYLSRLNVQLNMLSVIRYVICRSTFICYLYSDILPPLLLALILERGPFGRRLLGARRLDAMPFGRRTIARRFEL